MAGFRAFGPVLGGGGQAGPALCGELVAQLGPGDPFAHDDGRGANLRSLLIHGCGFELTEASRTRQARRGEAMSEQTGTSARIAGQRDPAADSSTPPVIDAAFARW